MISIDNGIAKINEEARRVLGVEQNDTLPEGLFFDVAFFKYQKTQKQLADVDERGVQVYANGYISEIDALFRQRTGLMIKKDQIENLLAEACLESLFDKTDFLIS